MLKSNLYKKDTITLLGLMSAVIFMLTACGNESAPTEPEENVTSVFSEKLEVSAESGMYPEDFELTILAARDETIYYTLDGSDPWVSETRIIYESALTITDRTKEPNVLSAIDPQLYQLFYKEKDCSVPKENIEKCTVLRVASVNQDGELTNTATRTFFVGKTAETYNNIPIISLVTDSDDFFDYETGIYMTGKTLDDWILENPKEKVESTSPCNYNQRGKDWEREVYIEFFETDGSVALSQNCGVRIQGNYSRGDFQKSLRFYARKDYGQGSFSYDFLGDKVGESLELTTKETFVLRTGANDSFYTKFKDSFLQSLVNDRDIETQAGRPCILFLDGEYWGLYTLQEDYSDNYFQQKYGVDKDQVVFYKNNELDEGEAEDLELYTDLIEFAKNNDFSVSDNYDEFCTMIDVESFIDYMATEMYIINEDWPGHNTGLWRTRTVDNSNEYADGRWRFTLYDTEMGVDHYGNRTTKYNINNLEKMLECEDDPGILFTALIKNNMFKEKFVTAFMDITNVNFESQQALSSMEDFKALYYDEMDRFFKRFPTWANKQNATDECLKKMIVFLENRGDYVPIMLRDTLDLKGKAVALTVAVNDTNGGEIRVNTTIPDISMGTWTGVYFTDYPITLSATAKDGYSFSGWSGGSQSSDTDIVISLHEASTITAIFTQD